MMKFWVVIFLLSSSQAAVLLTARNPDDFGGAVTFQNQDVLGQYDFGYNEGHPSGASFRRESGDAYGNKVGSFGLRDADGRIRVVRYVADSNGFRAEVTSNEPGVAPQDPASATINKPAVLPAPVLPVAAYPPPPPAAPIAVAPKAIPPPPVFYNYAPPSPVAIPRPLPPAYNYGPPAPVAAPAYFPPKVQFPAPVPAPYPAQVVGPVPVAPVPAPVPFAPVGSPVAVAPVPAKGIQPPSGYYNNVVSGKGYVGSFRNYPSLVPPFAAVPPQFGYLSIKSPPYYQPLGSLL